MSSPQQTAIDGLRSARKEALALQAWLRLLGDALPGTDPRWQPIRAYLGPGGDLDALLKGPQPPEGWPAVAQRIKEVRMGLVRDLSVKARQGVTDLRALLTGLGQKVHAEAGELEKSAPSLFPRARLALNNLTEANEKLGQAEKLDPATYEWGARVLAAQGLIKTAQAEIDQLGEFANFLDIADSLRYGVEAVGETVAAGAIAMAGWLGDKASDQVKKVPWWVWALGGYVAYKVVTK